MINIMNLFEILSIGYQNQTLSTREIGSTNSYPFSTSLINNENYDFVRMDI